MSNQVWQVRYLIKEIYPGATDFIVDETEERIYFENESEMQARINRDEEYVGFYYKVGEEWEWADGLWFDEVNEKNEAPIF